jgi:hypothetical protein
LGACFSAQISVANQQPLQTSMSMSDPRPDGQPPTPRAVEQVKVIQCMGREGKSVDIEADRD